MNVDVMKAIAAAVAVDSVKFVIKGSVVFRYKVVKTDEGVMVVYSLPLVDDSIRVANTIDKLLKVLLKHGVLISMPKNKEAHITKPTIKWLSSLTNKQRYVAYKIDSAATKDILKKWC